MATKFFNPMGGGINDSGMSRVHVMRAVEDSLRRLGTDWIDIYYVHHVDVETELDEMLYAVDALVRQGKVRYPACSNYEAWRLSEALWLSDHHGLARFACYQPQYSLVVRDIELELLPLCEYKRLGVAVWAPLAGGFLSGKYRPGMQVREGSRSADGWAYPSAYFAPTADATLALLLERAPETGRTPAQVALRWVLDRPAHHVGHRGSAQRRTVATEPRRRRLAAGLRTGGGADRGKRAGGALPAGDGRGDGAAPRRRRRDAERSRQQGVTHVSWHWELIHHHEFITEGPVWDGCSLFYSEIHASRTWRYDPDSGERVVWREHTGRANGMLRAPGGGLLACEGGGRRVVRYVAEADTEVIADRFEGKQFNEPNDLAQAAGGRIWFSDPNYGGRPMQLDHESVYCVDPGVSTGVDPGVSTGVDPGVSTSVDPGSPRGG